MSKQQAANIKTGQITTSQIKTGQIKTGRIITGKNKNWPNYNKPKLKLANSNWRNLAPDQNEIRVDQKHNWLNSLLNKINNTENTTKS